MTENEVVSLMESGQSDAEWNHNCDKVKAACGGYPDFWYEKIILSGLARRVMARHGGTDEIKVVSM